MWLYERRNLRGTEMSPHTPNILLTATVHLAFAFKALFPPGWHRNADRYVT